MNARGPARLLVAAVAGVAIVYIAVACSSGGKGTTHPKISYLPSPVPSAGCAKPASPNDGDVKVALRSQGHDRWFLLRTTVPVGFDTTRPRPLVVSLPGFAFPPQISSAITGMGALGAERGFVTATPAASGSPSNWLDQPASAANPDVVFVNDVIDKVEASVCIDTSRVYVVGMSSGAGLAALIACTDSKRITAVAMVAGATLPQPCKPERPIPALIVHGTDDPLMKFRGGIGLDRARMLADAAAKRIPIPTTTTTDPTDLVADSAPARFTIDGPGVPSTVSAWATMNHCDPAPQDKPLTHTAIVRTYRCPSDGDVTFFVVLGGGSTWPGSDLGRQLDGITGTTSLSFNATKVIWTFFADHKLP